MHEVRFREGETIFSEGDPGDYCYKILSGKVKICVNVHGLMRRKQLEEIAVCSEGEFIGDMSVIAQGPRSASAFAVEPTVCLAHTSEEIISLLQNQPDEALAYVRMMIDRLRRSTRKLSWSGTRHG